MFAKESQEQPAVQSAESESEDFGDFEDQESNSEPRQRPSQGLQRCDRMLEEPKLDG